MICPPTNFRHMDNNVYVIETGGMRFLMWGDNRPEPPQEVWDRIGSVDVVFVPVDGSRHILDYEQADSVVEKSGAKIAIPHHYLVPETTFFTSTLLPRHRVGADPRAHHARHRLDRDLEGGSRRKVGACLLLRLQQHGHRDGEGRLRRM